MGVRRITMVGAMCAVWMVWMACEEVPQPKFVPIATFPYVCANGTVASGTTTDREAERCVACDVGYFLNGEVCRANTYTCINGMAVSDGTPGTHNAELCAVCNVGYHREGASCRANVYACANGTAVPGIPAAHNTERCVACDVGYALTANACAKRIAATQVGAATDFGVNENFPYGLAAIGDTLYMVGQSTDVLYTLNTSSGVAARVGATAQFGVYEGFPRGLAAIDNTPADTSDDDYALYMVGDTTDALHILDTSTGKADSVGSSARFGVSEGSPRGLAAIGKTLYMVGGATAALYTLDTLSGAATKVGAVANFGVDAGAGAGGGAGAAVGKIKPHGLAAIGDTLYMVAQGADTAVQGIDILYTLDTSTGVATPIGTASQFGVSERKPRGLASIDNTPADKTDDDYTLYMVGQDTDALFTLVY